MGKIRIDVAIAFIVIINIIIYVFYYRQGQNERMQELQQLQDSLRREQQLNIVERGRNAALRKTANEAIRWHVRRYDSLKARDEASLKWYQKQISKYSKMTASELEIEMVNEYLAAMRDSTSR